ncbi:photosystem I reaction center subunit XI [Microcoleus sp. herbarium2]|uniref:photosystem I reaction center subunit XI n=1 Tax=Microcoleus sp. herbarium2 TaxID=3055433 RepID=UPI002FD29EE7
MSFSDITVTFLRKLPIYRKGLSRIVRGLEVSLAHGYFLVGLVAVLIRLQAKGLTPLAGWLATLTLILGRSPLLLAIAQIWKKTSHSIGIKLPKRGVYSGAVLSSVAHRQLFSAICC